MCGSQNADQRRYVGRRSVGRSSRQSCCEGCMHERMSSEASTNRMSLLPCAVGARESSAESTEAGSPSSSQPAQRRWVWGSNGSGCLGAGHCDDLYTPRLVTDASLVSHATRFTQISCGGCHTLAIDGPRRTRQQLQQPPSHHRQHLTSPSRHHCLCTCRCRSLVVMGREHASATWSVERRRTQPAHVQPPATPHQCSHQHASSRGRSRCRTRTVPFCVRRLDSLGVYH